MVLTGHVFHRDCIEGVLETGTYASCPICRAALGVNLYKIYVPYDEDEYDEILERAVRRYVSRNSSDSVLSRAGHRLTSSVAARRLGAIVKYRRAN